MKKYIKHILCISAFGALYSCSKDVVKPEAINDPEQTIAIKLAADFAVARYNVVLIDPEVTIENSNGLVPQYKWTVKVTGKDGVVKDSVICDTKTLQFIAPTANNYAVNFTVTSGKVTKQAATKVKVSETNKTYNSKALLLVDFFPAPGFSNDGLEFTDKSAVLSEMQLNLDNGDAITLGTFGGYVVTKFDHTVINAYAARDFIVQMSKTNNNIKFSPAGIFVAYDANKNGIADENEWYEIAGSEYHKSTTVKNYEMTYYKPDPVKPAVAGKAAWEFDTSYLKYTDNKNGSGAITKTTKFRRWNYYPQWLGDSYTLKGTKVYVPVKDVSDGAGTSFNVATFDWGYGGIKDSSIDISWAVDANGKKVHLPGIDFVKVYVPTMGAVGALDLLTCNYEETRDLNFYK
ncbi:hypothetical protein AQ505_15935 [Pedobacter sp. PACM 27299]|uniref:hypothetical protein n=1 Tax=Pedobacter sp. PACM 27299 TaxID=1727164 RepID=UPI000706A213|nr:hypothetical protein [Pedobacter sp. PACM 27299]ALL06846.1 hypothetical protein AQ505_15935 [Pedobacter sp. PACM 27299]